MKYTIICLLLSGCALFNDGSDQLQQQCIYPTPPSELMKAPSQIIVPSVESIEE